MKYYKVKDKYDKLILNNKSWNGKQIKKIQLEKERLFTERELEVFVRHLDLVIDDKAVNVSDIFEVIEKNHKNVIICFGKRYMGQEKNGR